MNNRCSCEYCTQDRRRETDRLLGRAETELTDLSWVAIAVVLLVLPLLLLGVLAAWLVGR